MAELHQKPAEIETSITHLIHDATLFFTDKSTRTSKGTHTAPFRPTFLTLRASSSPMEEDPKIAAECNGRSIATLQ